MFSFSRSVKVFQSDDTNLYPHWQCWKISVSPHTYQNSVRSVLLILVILVCLIILVEMYYQIVKLKVRDQQIWLMGQI